MHLEKIIVVPGDAPTILVTSSGSERITAREAGRYDDFATALTRSIRVAAFVQEGDKLPSVRERGTIFVCPLAVLEDSILTWPEQAQTVQHHTVLIDVPRTRALAEAERLGTAAVIETSQYLKWKNAADAGCSAIYGRKDVALSMGATWSDFPPHRAGRYALLGHPEFPNLPTLLGAYLKAYARAADTDESA
jgi:hypothetical protein